MGHISICNKWHGFSACLPFQSASAPATTRESPRTQSSASSSPRPSPLLGTPLAQPHCGTSHHPDFCSYKVANSGCSCLNPVSHLSIVSPSLLPHSPNPSVSFPHLLPTSWIHIPSPALDPTNSPMSSWIL